MESRSTRTDCWWVATVRLEPGWRVAAAIARGPNIVRTSIVVNVSGHIVVFAEPPDNPRFSTNKYLMGGAFLVPSDRTNKLLRLIEGQGVYVGEIYDADGNAVTNWRGVQF
jgi:hypothetical protein